ncbi:hypothetical protein J4233_05305 [Candidatus Pacearchaeota archaeon]|nr:hypothetical protein [Candidatus Pacearchaeota archaeon]
MKKRFVLLVSIIAISLIVSVSALLLAKNANNSPPANSSIACKVIQENSGGINLVFFAAEEQAKKYSNYILTVEPFANHKDKFSFYYITPGQFSPACEIYQGIAILCQSSALTKAASACPNDYIIVLGEEPSSIRSSAFKGVMSLNINHPLTVFAHEFAHVFDNFAEEYSSPGASIPRESENCQKKCSDFKKFPENTENYGCFKECTNADYYREFENGFMRSLNANRYGGLDENLLNEKILNQYRGKSDGNAITGKAISTAEDCANQQYYLVEQTEKGFVTTLETGCPNGARTFGDSTFQVKDASGNTVVETSVHSDILFTTDYNPELNGQITAVPQIIDTPIMFTIPATGKENSCKLVNADGNTLYQTSLAEVGATPCKN